MVPPDLGSRARNNNVGHTILNDGILRIHGVPAAFGLQPALIADNLRYLWQLVSDDLGFMAHIDDGTATSSLMLLIVKDLLPTRPERNAARVLP